MPLGANYNVLAQNNEQPGYEVFWTPLSVDLTSSAAVTLPTAAGAIGWVPGCVLEYNSTGVGATPGPGGDADGSTVYTVQTVDPAAVSTTGYMAGVLLGVGAPGSPAPVVPNTLSGTNALIAMVAKRGIVQVYVDNTTTIGHTLEVSPTSTHTGNAHDTGGTTFTYGTTFGIALQAVTVSAGPLLCWAAINFPL
jgi:hypothetical protein